MGNFPLAWPAATEAVDRIEERVAPSLCPKDLASLPRRHQQTRGYMKKQFEELKERSPALKRPARDPEVATMIALLEGKTTHEVWLNSWVSKSTIRRLRTAQTRHPQHSTMVTCANAVGFEYVLRRKR